MKMDGRLTDSTWVQPGHVRVGAGSISWALSWLDDHSGVTALVTGGRPDRVIESLGLRKEHENRFIIIPQSGGEPTLKAVIENLGKARSAGVTSVMAVGGGSAIDMGKALAGLVPQPESADPMDFLEVIGGGKPLVVNALPVLAAPTTAGTGAEATKNAVIASPEHRVKVSLRHASMVPAQVILDPALTLSLPASVTAATGMDAMTQLMEAFITLKRNPLTDAYCREGIRLVGRALEAVMSAPDNLQLRMDMLTAGYFSGVALANAGLGAVHGFAGPMGGMFGVPHGEICACLLPSVMETNAAELAKLSGTSAEADDLCRRIGEMADLVGCNEMSGSRAEADRARDLVAYLKHLKSSLGIPSMSGLGIHESEWDVLIEKSMASSSMKGNPVLLGAEQLRNILRNS